MRRLLRTTLLALGATLLLASCGGEKPNRQLLDKDAMVTINVEDGKSTRAENPDLPDNPLHLSPHDLVAQAENMIHDGEKYQGMRLWLGDILREDEYLVTSGKRKAGEYAYKLVDEAKFIFWGDFILDTVDPNNPKLNPDFFHYTNVHFVDKEGKIIGYIPQRIFREGWKKVKKAYEAKNYDEVYRLFQEVYTAFPCTPEEYEQLKAEGKN